MNQRESRVLLGNNITFLSLYIIVIYNMCSACVLLCLSFFRSHILTCWCFFIIQHFNIFKNVFLFLDGHHVWETEANVDKDSRKSVSRSEFHIQHIVFFPCIHSAYLFVLKGIVFRLSDIILMMQDLIVHTLAASGLYTLSLSDVTFAHSLLDVKEAAD